MGEEPAEKHHTISQSKMGRQCDAPGGGRDDLRDALAHRRRERDDPIDPLIVKVGESSREEGKLNEAVAMLSGHGLPSPAAHIRKRVVQI